MMKTLTASGAPIALTALSLLTGCLSQNPPLPTRYFEPERSRGERDATWPGRPVQAIHASAPSHLRDRMAWRISAVEMAFDDTHRWVAEPAAMVEDALRAELHERGGFSPAATTKDNVLEVIVDSFEGRLNEPRIARIELQARFHTENRQSTLLRRFHAEAPLADTGPEALARGIGIALREAAGDILDWVSEL